MPEFIRITATLLHRAQGAPLVGDDLSVAEREIIESIAKKRGAKSALFKIAERTNNSYRWTERGRATKRAIKARGGGQGVTGIDTVSTLTAEMLQTGSLEGERRFVDSISTFLPAACCWDAPAPIANFCAT